MTEVNEVISEARPVSPPGIAGSDGTLRREGKGATGAEARLEAAEAAIRAGVLKPGCGLLEKLLAAGPGYCGPHIDCRLGHQAEFAYRDKGIDTVFGPITLTRAWYHSVPGAATRWRPGTPGSAGKAHRFHRA
jgi:hypothetical protein